jgi:malate synthase
MEDTATAEISRSQIWQWLRRGVRLTDGSQVTTALVRNLLGDEMEKLRQQSGTGTFTRGRFDEARELLEALALGQGYPEFLTPAAYERID